MKPSSNADKNYHALYSLMMAVRNVLKIGAFEYQRMTELLLSTSAPLIFAHEVLLMLLEESHISRADEKLISSFQTDRDLYATHLPWIPEEKCENIYYVHNAFSSLSYDRVCAALGEISDDQLVELISFNRNRVWDAWNGAFLSTEVDCVYQLTHLLLQPLMYFSSCDLRNKVDREHLVKRINLKFPKTLGEIANRKVLLDTSKPRVQKKKSENSKPNHEVAEPPTLDTNTDHAGRSAPRVRQSRQSGRTASNSSDFGVAED